MANRISINLHWKQRKRFERVAKKTSDADERRRYLIILKYNEGKGATTISRELHCSHSTPHRVACRFQRLGEAGLIDGRCDNGERKANAECYDALLERLEGTPQDFEWARPTWTQELLAKEIYIETGIELSTSTVSRMLAQLGARKGRPRATVACPWPAERRKRRLREIKKVLDELPEDEVAVYEDEVDIHLNPKIGPDWMLPATQKDVPTPGKNEKRYIAGALDADTGDVHYVEADHKRSSLFVLLVLRLAHHVYPEAERIHIVLDNYGIHKSRITERAIEALGGRVVLHFLPPYCPNENRIEPLWNQLHDNVTRNHRCANMDDLMIEVIDFLEAASPFPGSMPSLRRSA